MTATADAVQDVGGVHGGAGKLATVVAAVDVEKKVAGSASALPELKVTTLSGAGHPDVQPGEEKVVHEVLPFACTLVAIFRL